METQVTSTSSQAPIQKKNNNKLIFIVVFAVLALCCLCTLVVSVLWIVNNAQQSKNNEQINTNNGNTNTPNTPQTQNPSNPPTDRGGEFTDLSGNFDVRIDNVRRNGKDYEVEMSVKNTSNTAQTFSTLLYLTLMSDVNEDGYSQNFFSSRYQEADAQLDGEIAAGQTKSGVVVYSVDDMPSFLTLRVSEGIFSDSYVDFEIE